MSGSQTADSVAADSLTVPGNLADTEEGSEGLSEDESMETGSCHDNTTGPASTVNVTDDNKDDSSPASPSILKGEGDWTVNLTGLRFLLETGGHSSNVAEPGGVHPPEGPSLSGPTKQTSKGLVGPDPASIEVRART